MEDDKHAATTRMKLLLGLPETEIEDAIERAVRGYTSSCLTFEDIEHIEALPADRLTHVEQCDFCDGLRHALLRSAPSHALAFVDLAANQYCARCIGNQGVTAFLGRLGFTPQLTDQFRKHFENVNVDEYIETAHRQLKESAGRAGDYAREHPVQVAAGAAGFMALGTALLVRALRE